MDHKIEVCGIQLNNQSSDETVRAVKQFFGRGRLYVVSYIYAELFKLLVQDEKLREAFLASSDLAVIGEKAVAEVLEEPCGLTEEELNTQAVANRILKYCAKNQKTVYWVGENENSYETFRAYADKHFTELQVVGAFAVGEEALVEIEEEMINDINRVTPDVILSKLPSPYQEQFVARQKMKLNSQVWLGLSSKANLSSEPVPASSKIKAMIDKTLLKRVVNANRPEE